MQSFFVSKIILSAITGCTILLLSLSAYAQGGISLAATRIIYNDNDKEESISITNSSEKARYLIQTWISNENGDKAKDFIITPPLFVSKPKSENTLRVMYIGDGLPKDKETVFYLHSKSIPSVNPNEIQEKNVLQIAIESVIKVFYRPSKLSGSPEKAQKNLVCKLKSGNLEINNPSPYYVSLVNVKVGEYKQKNIMVPPKETVSLLLTDKGINGKVTFQAVSDYGANTQPLMCK